MSTDEGLDEELYVEIIAALENMDEKEFNDDEAGLVYTMEADSKLDNLKLEVKPIDDLSESDAQSGNSKPNLRRHGCEDKADVANEENQLNTSFKEAKNVYQYFWEAKEVFSQWFPSRFTVDGKTFCCAEQYMMYTKASMSTKYLISLKTSNI